ncbi:MAG: hypothetical protein WBV98_02865, partial [Candidatus Sulfotelmatobacter sp.]
MLRQLPLLLCRVQIERAANGAQEVGSVQLRFLHPVPSAGVDDGGNRFLIRLLGQRDERYGPAPLKKICKKAGGSGISRL